MIVTCSLWHWRGAVCSVYLLIHYSKSKATEENNLYYCFVLLATKRRSELQQLKLSHTNPGAGVYRPRPPPPTCWISQLSVAAVPRVRRAPWGVCWIWVATAANWWSVSFPPSSLQSSPLVGEEMCPCIVFLGGFAILLFIYLFYPWLIKVF